MIGLAYLIAGALYLALLVWVTRGAYRWAQREGLSKARCWLVATCGFLVVYLPVFWDHIPTIVAHQYYCATKAGFTVFKTVEKWKKENPGVAETIKSYGTNINELPYRPGGITLLNERFQSVLEIEPMGILPNSKITTAVIDSVTGEVIAKNVNFRTGYGNPMVSSDWHGWKFWLSIESCLPAAANKGARELMNYRNQIISIGRDK